MAVPSPRREPAYAAPVRHEPDEHDERLKGLVGFLARALVDHPDDVQVEQLEAGPDAAFELRVNQEDLAHVIGRQGRTARSMRLVLSAAAAKVERRATLEIAD